MLPDDKFYAICGDASGYLNGMITGQGKSNNGTYTANVTDFFWAGVTYSGNLGASYVAGSRLNGTLNETGVGTNTFTATVLPASSFNYNTPESLSAVSGTWTGALLDGTTTTITIGSDGTVSGSSSGCSSTGTVAPDSSNKNFFNVSLAFGSSPCAFPNQTASGIGVEYLLSDGVNHQLLAAVTIGTSAGTVFAATR